MSLCDTCRSPGSCCRGFVIENTGFERERWKQDARQWIRRKKLPFYPAHMTASNLPEWDYVYVAFNCHWLGEDGRCRNYDQRPAVCRNYEPASDGLCAEHVLNLKGIPIRTIHATPHPLHNVAQDILP